MGVFARDVFTARVAAARFGLGEVGFDVIKHTSQGNAYLSFWSCANCITIDAHQKDTEI
jgi:hypothetical protein